jgi:hypothetical protein
MDARKRAYGFNAGYDADDGLQPLDHVWRMDAPDEKK